MNTESRYGVDTVFILVRYCLHRKNMRRKSGLGLTVHPKGRRDEPNHGGNQHPPFDLGQAHTAAEKQQCGHDRTGQSEPGEGLEENSHAADGLRAEAAGARSTWRNGFWKTQLNKT